MMKIRYLVAGALCSLSCACSDHIAILSANRVPLLDVDVRNIRALGSYPADRAYEKIELTVAREDLVRALGGESTLFIDVSDCADAGTKFPAVAFYLNIPLDEPRREAVEKVGQDRGNARLSGYVPLTFSRGLSSVCARLSGGSYLGTRVTSPIVPVSPGAAS